MRVNNNTSRSLAEIKAMPIVGKIKNNWRGRWVTLYRDATLEGSGLLYMVGITLDGQLTIVTLERAGMNEKTAMDYWNHGQKTLVID